jgi:NADH-quinone oxidoreductase subunit L
LSKDAVIESAWAGTQGGYAFWMLVIAALMTSFYSWRLMFLTFFGTARGDKHTHQNAHESPKIMLIPLGVLSVGSIFAGMVWYGSFFGDHDQINRFFGIPAHNAEASEGADSHGEGVVAAAEELAEGDVEAAADAALATTEGEPTEASGAQEEVAAAGDVIPGIAPAGAIYMGENNTVIDDAHHAPKWVKVSPFVAMVLGFLIAMWFYIWNPGTPAKFVAAQRPLYTFLLNKWYFDELYDVLFVQPAKKLGGVLWKRGDGTVIDGSINGVAMGIVPFFTRLAGRAQSGYIFTYAFAMVIGIAVLVTWMTFTGGAN